LSTFSVAEQLYDALLTWESTGFIEVTEISLAFFRQLWPNTHTGKYYQLEWEYWQIRRAVKIFADGFIEIAAKYTPSDGSLSEQFDRQTGAPTSARDLTWSYASVLTAGDSFAGVRPVNWGAKGLVVPSTCTPNPGPKVHVTFDVRKLTNFGGKKAHQRCCVDLASMILSIENVYIAGSVDALKLWSPVDAPRLSPEHYPIWTSMSC
jgi:glucoamylase